MSKCKQFFLIIFGITYLNYSSCNEGMIFFKFIYNDKDIFKPTCTISGMLVLYLIEQDYSKINNIASSSLFVVAVGCGTLSILINLYCKNEKIKEIIKSKDKIIESYIKDSRQKANELRDQINSLNREKNELKYHIEKFENVFKKIPL